MCGRWNAIGHLHVFPSFSSPPSYSFSDPYLLWSKFWILSWAVKIVTLSLYRMRFGKEGWYTQGVQKRSTRDIFFKVHSVMLKLFTHARIPLLILQSIKATMLDSVLGLCFSTWLVSPFRFLCTNGLWMQPFVPPHGMARFHSVYQLQPLFKIWEWGKNIVFCCESICC